MNLWFNPIKKKGCETCPFYMEQEGINLSRWDYLIALAGNPNTGKSTLFNSLTGLRQHVGNWAGKTVARAEGAFKWKDKSYKVVDLPGTYSLLSSSVEEEIARDFLLFGQPDLVIVLMDATSVERNLNLTLQILEITSKVVVALNLVDEAKRKGIFIDGPGLAQELGVPVVPTVARKGEGLSLLLSTAEEVLQGRMVTHPRKIPLEAALEKAVEELARDLREEYPTLTNPRWVALRLLDGDPTIQRILEKGETPWENQSSKKQTS